MFNEKVDVFGARPAKEIETFSLRPIGRSPQIGRAAENFDNFVPQKESEGHFQVITMPAINESIRTKVGLLVELYTNPPSDLY